MTFKRFEVDFFTASILGRKHLLKPEQYKLIIIDSLRYLVQIHRVYLNTFVLMDSHIHLLWQIRVGNTRPQVQRDFLKFTAQQIQKDLYKHHPEGLEHFCVSAKDRKYQIWERNALSVAIWSEAIFYQKLAYIHQNPVRAGLCASPEAYVYSSAAFYLTGEDRFGILNPIAY
ncbi:MAG TPA: hypothetical protein VL092_09125 [Chitinophagaceae bacterium]|nr:hypothetical protein [Chitinophagaceae bacterium]